MIPTDVDTKEASETSDVGTDDGIVNKKQCEPGTTFNIDCNSCHCTETGIPACTRKNCVESLRPTEGEHAVEKRSTGEKECEPGTTFKRDCNTCQCTPTGLAVCTKMRCITLPLPSTTETGHVKKRSVDETQAEKECEPGTKWKDDCNS